MRTASFMARLYPFLEHVASRWAIAYPRGVSGPYAHFACHLHGRRRSRRAATYRDRDRRATREGRSTNRRVQLIVMR